MNLGNLDITKLCVGAEEALSACIGTQVVWSTSSPSPTGSPKDVVWVDNSGTTHIDNYSAGTIPDRQYQYNTTLVSVVIGDGITDIGTTNFSYVFVGCTSLSSATIGSGVTYIGGRAFENTPSLSSITIPASVTYIDNNAFYNFDTNCTITFEGPCPSFGMDEGSDLGFGTNIIVQDEYLSDYCDALCPYECVSPLYIVSDEGTECDNCNCEQTCEEGGLCGEYPDCYPCGDEDPCGDWEGNGYSSYEDCTCQNYGQNCDEGDPCDEYEPGSQERCECEGGTWNGEYCEWPDPEDPCQEDPCSCDPNPDECRCTEQGGTWDPEANDGAGDCIFE